MPVADRSRATTAPRSSGPIGRIVETLERWQAGDRAGAAALISDDMVLATTLIGTASMVRDRLQVWCDTGVDTVRVYPAGERLEDRIATLGAAIELVHSIERTRR